jgi:hypothetical protein
MNLRMERIVFSLALVLAVGFLLLAGCATTGTAQFKTVTVDQVVQMSKAGTSPDEIIKQIAESGTVYRLNASQLADLRQAGVSDQVINYMQQTYLDAVRRDQVREDMRYWAPGPGGYWYGGVPYGWW